MRRLASVLLCLLMPAAAIADDSIENAPELYVTGKIQIASNGIVTAVDVVDGAPTQEIVDAVRRGTSRWKFEPQATEATINLRLRAVPYQGHTSVWLDGVAFDSPRMKSAPDPQFPKAGNKPAYAANIQVLVTVNADGSVDEAEAYSGQLIGEKTNEKNQTRAMEAFAEAAVEAVEQWQYEAADLSGEAAQRTFLTQVRFANEQAENVPHTFMALADKDVAEAESDAVQKAVRAVPQGRSVALQPRVRPAEPIVGQWM
jgi:hypothetical protein